MIGPVFNVEVQQAGRRGRLNQLRFWYSGWLVLQLLVLFAQYLGDREVHRHVPGAWDDDRPTAATGRFVNGYMETFVTQHFVLLLLLTPTFVAGAITDEKTRGTLQFLLCADVSSWDIVIGKLLGRVVQVAFLAAAGLPFICFIGGFGSLDALTLLGLAGVTVGPLLGLGAASILFSVCSRETRDAVLRVYVALVVAVIALAMLHAFAQSAPVGPAAPFWSEFYSACERADEAANCLYPLHVLRPSWNDHDHLTMLRRLLIGLMLWTSFGALCTSLAARRLRPAYLRQLDSVQRRARKSAARRQEVDDDPVAWKEREVEGLALLTSLRQLPGLSVYVLVAAATFALFWWLGRGALGLAFFFPFGGASIVAMRASGTVCRERDRQTWDLLLLTPLDTKDLLQSKLRGVMQAIRPYLIAYGIAIVGLLLTGEIELSLVSLLYLGMGWGAMYYMAAVGIMWSVRSQSAWKSLLATLASGYLSIVALFFGWSIVFMCLTGCLGMMASGPFGRSPFDAVFFILLTLVMLGLYAYGLFYFLRKWARSSLNRAENWINKNERVWVLKQAATPRFEPEAGSRERLVM